MGRAFIVSDVEKFGDKHSTHFVRSANEQKWRNHRDALRQARTTHENWSDIRRQKTNKNDTIGWKRETFILPRTEAQQKARDFLQKYPKAAYWSEVEAWRELPHDVIEFTMRRLPTAD